MRSLLPIDTLPLKCSVRIFFCALLKISESVGLDIPSRFARFAGVYLFRVVEIAFLQSDLENFLLPLSERALVPEVD